MSHVLDRLELLERRVTALEAGHALDPAAWLRPAPARPPERAPTAPREPRGPMEVAVPSSFGPVLSGSTPDSAGSDPFESPAPGPVVPAVPSLRRREGGHGTPKPPRDLEAWLGGVVLGRVGIAAVVLAAAYFAQLAYRTVGDTAKVLSLYALGAVLVAAGSFVRARVGARYVGLLWGGATAVMYIAGLAATLRYHIVPAWTGVALLAAAAALGQILSRALRNQTIATVSVAAAMSAPFLLGVATSPGPVLLAYAAGVHLWAAWTERAWGWTWARNAALAGAAVLAVAWSTGPGMDHLGATFLALHVFALVVLAPDLWLTWRGGAPRPLITTATLAGVTVLDAFLLGSEFWLDVDGLRGGGLVAGAAWLGLAVLLAPRAQTPRAQVLMRGLATLGGVVLAVGSVLVWQQPHLPWGALGSLAVLAPALLFLRRRVGAGDAGVVAAALLALLIVSWESAWLVDPQGAVHVGAALVPLLLIALVPAGALALAGRTGGTRSTGLLLGATTLALAFLVPTTHVNAAWAALGLTLPALWSLLWSERARRTGDVALAGTVNLITLVLAAIWALGLTTLGRAHGWNNAFDPHTWSALVLTGVLLTLRLRRVAYARWQPDFRPVQMAAAIGLLLLAGGRETHLMTRHLSPAAHSAALALFAAAAALALAVNARVGNRLGRAATAVGCLAAGALLVLAQGMDGASGTSFVLGLLGVGLATGISTEVLLRRKGDRPEWLGGAVLPLLILGFAWFAAAQLVPHAPAQPIWNDRFLGGLGLTLLLAGTTWSTWRASGPRAARWLAGIGALLVGYLAGLFELVQATRPLAGAWAPVLVSLYTAAFGAAMLIAGFGWNLRPLRMAALAVFGAVVAKVGFYDLAASDLPLRVLVTGVLGLVLLGSAYAYARHRRAAPVE